MSVYHVDIKYMRMLPLDQFEDMGNGRYNFRCPVCGDSQQKHKKRGWFIEYQGEIFMKCFNCDYSSSFEYFIKTFFPIFYDDYKKECIQESGSFGRKIYAPTPTKSTFNVFGRSYNTLDLQRIGDLPDNHRAVTYLKSRKLKWKIVKDFYYTDEFGVWAHKKQPTMFTHSEGLDRRIVIPSYTKHGRIFMVSARALDGQSPKYLTLKFDENHPKLFGLERIDINKSILVTEGQFDSLLLPNSIAMSGAVSGLDKLTSLFVKSQLIIVPDNEPRNVDTCNFIETALRKGFRVVIYPSNFPYKDINEAVLDGVSVRDILTMFKDNIYSGLRGIVKIKTWRKTIDCRKYKSSR